MIKNEEFVECVLCKFAGKKITQHVKSQHGITKEDYEKIHGKTICISASGAYSETKNFDWINRAKNSGVNLEKYREKMSKSVSSSVMSNQAERFRRAKMMSALNRTDASRKRSAKNVINNQIRKNSLWGSSLIERKFKKRLEEIYQDVVHFYVINEWNIDFYIPSVNAFIQFDGKYWHGLDRPLSVISMKKSKRDEVILKSYNRDRAQDEWFKSKKLRFIRVTDSAFKKNQSQCLNLLSSILNTPSVIFEKIDDVDVSSE